MATLSQLKAGLAGRLATIPSIGTRTYGDADAQVETPGVVIRHGTPVVTYASTQDGTCDYLLSVLLLVSTAAGASSSDALDAYLDPSGADSVFAAVQADSSLGGVADDAVVTSVSNAGLLERQGVSYLGAEFLVTVYA